MSEKPVHPIDAIHDAISGRLSGPERAELERHLSGCESCRREFEVLSALRQRMGAAIGETPPVPDDLEAHVRRALDVDGTWAGQVALAPRPGAYSAAWKRWGRTAAALVAAAVLVWVVVRPDAPAAPTEVAEDLRRYAAGTLPVDTSTSDPAVLDARLRSADLGFATRVFDFAQMSIVLTGGGVHSVGGQPSALFVYDGPDALRLLCQMYLGSIDELPAPAERRTNAGIEFLIYREGGVTVVFWAEDGGRVVCALAANGDPDAAVQLAFAKAIGGDSGR